MALFRVHALLRVLPLGLVALACAAGGVSTRSGDAGQDRVALAPLNLSLGHHPQLAEAEEVVERELIRFLQERNIHVGLVHQGDAERAWNDAYRASEALTDAGERLEEAARVFAVVLRNHSDFEFDYVVMASVVYRDARVRGRIARWDGVRRRVVSRRARGASQGHYFRDWEGEITGLSLHVRVYEPDGRRVHEGWGGLDLTHDPVAVGAAMSPQPIPQATILENPEHVRQGVELALRPYLGVRGR